jgi:hypothetical protein
MFKFNYNTWEKWLYLSLIAFICLMFIGTLENSRENYPNWHIYMLVVMINLLACIVVGATSKE